MLWHFREMGHIEKHSFFNVGTICEKMMGYPKGRNPLGSGFPIGARSIPVGTRFCLQSLVCYTFCSRWRWKGAVFVATRRFSVTAGLADFAESDMQKLNEA